MVATLGVAWLATQRGAPLSMAAIRTPCVEFEQVKPGREPGD